MLTALRVARHYADCRHSAHFATYLLHLITAFLLNYIRRAGARPMMADAGKDMGGADISLRITLISGDIADGIDATS